MKDEKRGWPGVGGGKYRDFVFFGRVISTGLVVAGYAFVGVYLSRWLDARGFPSWLVALTPPAAVVFGLWQGWLFLSETVRKAGRSKKTEE